MAIEDMELLRQYAEKGLETAFAELVTRHVNLVYSVAMRQTRSLQLAEEVTQTVFVILARKAGSLSRKTILPGWLCRTAHFVSAKAVTSQKRRQIREHEAYMQNLSTAPEETASWSEMEPVLDAALGELGRNDQDALILRFLQNRSFKEVAASIGTTEAAAKMRVNRALEKLRAAFARRGVAVTSVLIAAALSANSVQAAPAGVAGAVAGAALGAGRLAPSTVHLIKVTMKFMAIKKATTGAVLGLALLAAGTGTFVLQQKYARAAEGNASVPINPAAGYATPEETFNTMLAALKAGDQKKFEEACTPKQAARSRSQNGSKSSEQIKAEADRKLHEFANFSISGKEQVSPDEVHLKIRTAQQASPGQPAPRVIVFRMRQIGRDWKFDGTGQ
jgi:RNA polymerase sigma factor (sigma-70 family)